MKRTFTIIASLILAVLLFSCATRKPVIYFGHLGEAHDLVPLNRNVLTGTLPNGLRYFILENHRPENRAFVSLVVYAGSVVERDYERGFAHFVEHMAFRGTARFPETELVDFLRSLGMRFGPDLNAFVSYNETVYHFEVPVEVIDGTRRIPDRALAILDDWTHAINFHPEDVESERLVVLEEVRFRAGANQRAWDTFLPILFANSAFEDRAPIGLVETIENATPEMLKAFWQRWYVADNMALVFIGDFDAEALQADLVNHFNMPAPAEPINHPRYDLPPPVRGNFHVEIFTDPELTSTHFMIYDKLERGARRGTLAYFRQSMIDSLIHTMLNRRFDEKTTNPDASAVSSWGNIWRWGPAARFYYFGTTPKTGRAEEALLELMLEMESMRRHGFSEAELGRAKRILTSSMERQLSEKDRRESRTFAAGFRAHFMFGAAMPDIEWETEAFLTLLPGITLNEVNRAARNYFSARDRIVFLMAPEAEADRLPDERRIRAIFRQAERARIPPRPAEVLAGELLERRPVPGTIVSEVTDAETGAVILTLSNDTQVILKETANRNNEIIMHARARGGTTNAPEAEIFSARLASQMVQVSGLGQFSRTELVNMLAGKEVSMSFWTAAYSRGFQGSSTTGDLRTLFEMIHLFFTQPNFDERAIAAMKDRQRTSLAHQDDDPEGYFRRTLSRIINDNSPHFRPWELADMDMVSVEQAFSFILRALNPGDYTFVFAGNIDKDEMRYLAATYLASIPNAPSMTEWTDPQITRPSALTRNIYRGQDERTVVYLCWFTRGTEGFDEQTNQTAAVLQEYIRIMLNDEIRERRSGVYAIWSWASVSAIPAREYRMDIQFHCDPARAEELIDAVIYHITDVFTTPLNMDRFNMAVEAMLMQHANSIQRNQYIAESFTNSAVMFNTPLARLYRRPDAIRAVRPEDVQNLARTMASSAPVLAVLFPEAWD